MAFKLSIHQKTALDILILGYNVFLTGGAGTGKSYILSAFIDYVEANTNKNLVICAPTGIAAVNLGGCTIHSVFKAPAHAIVKPAKEISEIVEAADIIIIDEISMCRQDLFDFIGAQLKDVMLHQGKNIQVIVVGDFYQLAPVLSDTDKELLGIEGGGYAFNSRYWKFFNFTSIVLTEVVRQQNIEFATSLNLIRQGDPTYIDYINYIAAKDKNDGVSLCGTNKIAAQVNKDEYNKVQSPERIYFAKVSGKMADSERPVDAIICLKIGTRVMTTVNEKTMDDSIGAYQNGSVGTVVDMYDTYVKVKMDVSGKIVRIAPYKWHMYEYKVVENFNGKKHIEKRIRAKFSQLPLKLAYAITIHKSQGQTYDKVNIYPYCFTVGQLYVALSRVRSPENMHLMYPIERQYLLTSPEVQDFYKSLIP